VSLRGGRKFVDALLDSRHPDLAAAGPGLIEQDLRSIAVPGRAPLQQHAGPFQAGVDHGAPGSDPILKVDGSGEVLVGVLVAAQHRFEQWIGWRVSVSGR
jgi:hypothetical protein